MILLDDKNKKVMCRKILKSRLQFKHKISDEAKDIISGLLQRDPNVRVGIVGGGFKDVKEHPFFTGIDWELLYERKLEPPFKPKLAHATDNFDREFTDQSARISEHENKDSEEVEEDDDEEDVFEDFNFTRPIAEDFWEIQG